MGLKVLWPLDTEWYFDKGNIDDDDDDDMEAYWHDLEKLKPKLPYKWWLLCLPICEPERLIFTACCKNSPWGRIDRILLMIEAQSRSFQVH